ncbi:MAG: DUF4333 domain-containing protein [Actinomycetota bacterium]|nr:DUF4333 domain-containing protein [Actinomycetota bacterium]
MKQSAQLAASLSAMLFVLPLASCGGDEKKSGSEKKPAAPAESKPEVSTAADIEQKLEQALSGSSSTTAPGATSGPKVQAVTCPPDVRPAKGKSFTCEATGDQGLKGAIEVTPKSDSGTPFSYKGSLRGQGVTQKTSGTLN